jgi:hypothetical protein
MNDTKAELCIWAFVGGGGLGVALAAISDAAPTAFNGPPVWMYAAVISAVSLPFLGWHFGKLDRFAADHKILAGAAPVRAQLHPQP